MTIINWTESLLDEFKLEYKIAIRNGQRRFIFKDNQFLTDYAKWLILYLDGLFGKTTTTN